MEALKYGRTYWNLEYGLIIGVDRIPANTTVEARSDTLTLLQLVALSRVAVKPQDAHWNLPDRDDIRATIVDMRAELGGAEEYERLMSDPDTQGSSDSLFPGVHRKMIVDYLISGELLLGNEEQPEPVCYHNP